MDRRHTEACYTCKYAKFDDAQYLLPTSDKIYLCKNDQSENYDKNVAWYTKCNVYEFNLPIS